MVTPRNGVTFNQLQRTVFDRIIDQFGREDISLTTNVRTLDSNKRVIAVTATTTTIKGDLQFVSYQDKQILDTGVANVGDGIFYCVYSTALYEHDYVVVDGITWEFVQMVEAETIGTGRVYQAWITRRRQ